MVAIHGLNRDMKLYTLAMITVDVQLRSREDSRFRRFYRKSFSKAWKLPLDFWYLNSFYKNFCARNIGKISYKRFSILNVVRRACKT